MKLVLSLNAEIRSLEFKKKSPFLHVLKSEKESYVNALLGRSSCLNWNKSYNK